MKELISMGFQLRSSVVGFLTGPAVPATAIFPVVFHAPETDVAFEAVEGFADGILSVGGLGAVH